MIYNSVKIVAILAIVAISCELGDASPTLTVAGHSVSFKRPSFRLGGSKRMNSLGELDESSAKSRLVSRSSRLNPSASTSPIDGDLSGFKDSAGSGPLCTEKTFEMLSNIENLDEIDNKIRRSDLEKCALFLIDRLNETISRAKITPEAEQNLEKFRKNVKETDDDSDFDTDKLYQHVPKMNLALALIAYSAEKNILRDPRSDKFPFEENMRNIYNTICEPIGGQEFSSLLEKFDILDQVLYSRNPTIEIHDDIEKWISNIRICSYLQEPRINDLLKSTKQVLSDQLGDDIIEDPVEY